MAINLKNKTLISATLAHLIADFIFELNLWCSVLVSLIFFCFTICILFSVRYLKLSNKTSYTNNDKLKFVGRLFMISGGCFPLLYLALPALTAVRLTILLLLSTIFIGLLLMDDGFEIFLLKEQK